MAEPRQRSLGKDLMFLLVPAAIAMLVLLALALGSAHAGHGGPHVKWAPTDDPAQDLSVTPLVMLNVGSEANIDLVVELPTASDSIFAFASDFNISFDPRVVAPRGDAEPETPGFQINVSDADLALGDKERLITTVDGFADDGDIPRGCNFDPTPPAGDDSVYTFIKGATGDDTNIQLQLLDQHERPEWGEGWCGPTAAGISLGWFAETASGANLDHANLIPDTNGNSVIDSADKFEAINTLGAFMQTSSADGTTDNNLLDGLESYINSRGLTGDFVIKVFNHPRVFEYFNELQTGDEDVLVRITSGDGSSHWLVGRSFSNVRDDKGTPDDFLDDTFAVSFVDPGTASVYHTQMLFGRRILYSGDLVEFDLMVSVSPTDVPTDEDTAQYFVIRNELFGEPPFNTLTGDLSFTLLGDPNTGDPRTPQLTGDADGRVFRHA